MKPIFNAIRKKGAIAGILICAFLLRIWNLDFQSLWLDELHTMVEADPSQSWSHFFNMLRCCDQHPPLHYVIERFSFSIFGHTAYVARFTSVITGTVGVYAMFLLGKTIYNHRLGLIAALLTTINFYAIKYSQEARGYMLAFTFAALSFTYFIKIVKVPNRINALLYALFTLCLLYTHYYSLFIVASQSLLALIFILQETGDERKQMFKAYLTAAVIIILGYTPWLPFLVTVSEIKSFWITNISDAFMANFFSEYFGDSQLLIPVIILLLVVYILHATLSVYKGEPRKLKDSPLSFSLFVCICWVFTTYMITYIRSVLVVPMLFPRYTIVVLPAILLAVAIGIALFKSNSVKAMIISLVVVISITDLIVSKDFYNKVSKTQFREIMQFVADENPDNYPMINERTSAQNSYFIKYLNIKSDVFSAKKEDLVDSILNKSSDKYNLDGFWIISAHSEPELDTAKRRQLETSFISTRKGEFMDASAELFVSRELESDDYIVLRYDDWGNDGTQYPDIQKLAIWTGAIHSQPVSIRKGKYNVSILAYGTSAKGVFPHLNIYFNDALLTDYFLTGTNEKHQFIFENLQDRDIIIKIEMDNDLSIPNGEDRNVFLDKIMLERLKE
ncbi:MAG: glycosyltransferase family 39 protein [Bacteroidia bacterium]